MYFSLPKRVYLLLASLFTRDDISSFTAPKLPTFTLIEIVRKPTLKVPIYVGIYTDRDDKKWIVKSWAGKINSFHKKALEDEIQMNKIIGGKRIVTHNGFEIYIPKIVNAVKSRSELYYIREYIEGKTIDLKNKSILWECVVNYKDFGTSIDRSHITVNSVLTVYLSYYLFILLALISQPPSNKSHFYKSIWYMILNAPFVIKMSFKRRSLLSLIHRDLYFKNILMTDNKISIIDIGESQFSDPLVEYTYLVSREVSQMHDPYKIVTLDIERMLKSPEEIRLFRILLLCRVVSVLWHSKLDKKSHKELLPIISYISSNEYVFKSVE